MKMNLMNALVRSYDYALENDLVGNHNLSNDGSVILPIYHTNMKSDGNNIFELVLDEEGNAIDGSFLEDGEVIVYPITEDSIVRTSKASPHPLSDNLIYLSRDLDENKNKVYLDEVEKILEYEEKHKNENMRILGSYIRKNRILEDFLYYFLGDANYSIDKKANNSKLNYEEEQDGKSKKKSINLKTIFISFRINKLFDSDIKISRDSELYQFYIDYVNYQNKDKAKEFCNILGKEAYSTTKHRPVLGTAKLISASNNKKTYYGRIKNENHIYTISFEASQKAHNMLKFFIDSSQYKRNLGEGTYLINWLDQDLGKGGLDLKDKLDFDYDMEEAGLEDFGDLLSKELANYFLGDGGDFARNGRFYILIIEKISNGRVSVKYFNSLSRSQAYERVKNWYTTTQWSFYDFKSKKNIVKSPSLNEIVNFSYGGETNKGYISCENKALKKASIESLIPCIVESKKIPHNILKAAHNNLKNKSSYKKTWNQAVFIGSALRKKAFYDYKNTMIYHDKLEEVEILKNNKSFYYGKLMAIYEAIEDTAIRQKNGSRLTNADRLWSSMIRSPERTRLILESKVKPYMNILKRQNIASFIYYDKLITEITVKILELSETTGDNRSSLDEDFILGYYYQKNERYKRKED